MCAQIEDFFGGDSLDDFGVVFVFVIEGVVWFEVLEDGLVALVRADEGSVGGAEEGDDFPVETHRHVQGSGIIGDDEVCARDDGHQLGDGS